MALVGKPHIPDRSGTPGFSGCEHLRNGHGGGAVEIRRPFSRTPDVTDFSFPMPPAAAETYAADEAFLHGRLLPFNISQPSPLANRVGAEKLGQTLSFNHRRGKSLDGNARQTATDARQADYLRLRRASSDPRPVPATGKCSKWPLFMLGPLTFPPEMEMRDIRNRQRRRGPLPSAAPSGSTENGRRRSRWQILRALSCRAAENAAMSPARAAG